MGRSQKWPGLRSQISKIRDIRFVGTDELIIFWKFHNFPWSIVAVARLESYFVVGSLDLTWWPDLTWHWVEIFTKVAEKMGGKVGENPAALRAAVFSLSSKNLRGGGDVQTPPPPSRARVNLSNMLTAWAIAPAVEQIASPVTGICPRSENLNFNANYVPYKLLAWIKLLAWKMG